ncbi:hypothetical protein HHL22_03050 [Hymenobacter sp. RP-2-7]|uniref:Outer membrane protein beta-barrel domain-containing protein n=1 Tax=Hymenobacter polaris TaxID=2682546 RepID=A0A7Y0ABB1_9BACT|nr:hypothetical protein [Hymenobacter polaris]NML64174.1 hypothetical protein [Hymenobacter polaris]
MRKILYALFLVAGTRPALAQHSELLGRAGLNLSHFVGSSAEQESFINYSGAGHGYTNNPFGGRLGLGAGAGLRLLHESRWPLLLGLDLGYDYQRARTAITGLSYSSYPTYSFYAADGHTYLASQHVSLFFALGYRLHLGAVRLDVLAGPELAAVFGKREAGRGTYYNNGDQAWATNEGRDSGLPFDGLLRADLTAWRGRWGLNGSYAWGGVNYRSGLVGGGPSEAFDRSLRLGLVYRLKPRATP